MENFLLSQVREEQIFLLLCDVPSEHSLVYETNSSHFNKGENINYFPWGSSIIFTLKKAWKREREKKYRKHKKCNTSCLLKSSINKLLFYWISLDPVGQWIAFYGNRLFVINEANLLLWPKKKWTWTLTAHRKIPKEIAEMKRKLQIKISGGSRRRCREVSSINQFSLVFDTLDISFLWMKTRFNQNDSGSIFYWLHFSLPKCWWGNLRSISRLCCEANEIINFLSFLLV